MITEELLFMVLIILCKCKEEDKANCGCGVMTNDVIQFKRRAYRSDIMLLQGMKAMADCIWL